MKKIITFFIIIITFIMVIKFISPDQEEAVPFIQPTSTPSPTLRDLEKELESIDPKVLDSDFNE